MEMQASNENESYNKARGLAPPSKSPAVRVHINVESNKPPAQEVIRRVTQAHEVVEVDGFIFKRKRSILEPTANTTEQDQPASKRPKLPDSTPDAQVLQPKECNTPAPAAAPAAESTAEGDVAVDVATVKTPDAKAVSAATTALLEQLPADLSEPDRLASLCELLCAAEMDELTTSKTQEQQLDAAVADTVRQALGTFVRAVHSSAAAGDFQAAPPAEVQGAHQQDSEEEDVLFSVDLEARKAGLRAQLALFAKEEEEWQEVLAQQDSFQQAAEPVRHAVQAAGNTGSSPGAVHGPGALDTAEAPVLSDPVSRDSNRESMQPDVNMPAAEDQPNTITAVEGSSVMLQSGVGLLRKAEVDAHRKVTMQVEGLCSMVSGVEELVAKAERHCTAMQAKYHQDRFRAYLHVDSPAKLIQELLKPGGAVPSMPL